MMKNKLLKMLAVMGALLGTTPKANAEGADDQQRDLKTDANVTLFVNGEKSSDQKGFGDITIKPHIGVEADQKGVYYEGSFYRWGELDGGKTDWMTLMSKLVLHTEDWEAMIGRECTPFQTAGYKNVPATTFFSNDVRLNGTSRGFTGSSLNYKPWGVEIGTLATGCKAGPHHWDNALVGYKKQFNNAWGVQFQAAGGARPLTYGGATVAWTPDKNNAVVGEIMYKNHKTTGVLSAKHNITDKLALFANAEVCKPSSGKIGGIAEAGISYNIGKGFTAVAGIQQGIGGEHKTQAVIGLQYVGNYSATK